MGADLFCFFLGVAFGLCKCFLSSSHAHTKGGGERHNKRGCRHICQTFKVAKLSGRVASRHDVRSTASLVMHEQICWAMEDDQARRQMFVKSLHGSIKSPFWHGVREPIWTEAGEVSLPSTKFIGHHT